MCDFKVGDEVTSVLHVDDDTPSSRLSRGRNGIYVIDHLSVLETERGAQVAVWFVGEWSDHPTGAWDASYFRKVQRRDLQAWLSTAAPAPHLDKRPKKRVPA